RELAELQHRATGEDIPLDRDPGLERDPEAAERLAAGQEPVHPLVPHVRHEDRVPLDHEDAGCAGTELPGPAARPPDRAHVLARRGEYLEMRGLPVQHKDLARGGDPEPGDLAELVFGVAVRRADPQVLGERDPRAGPPDSGRRVLHDLHAGAVPHRAGPTTTRIPRRACPQRKGRGQAHDPSPGLHPFPLLSRTRRLLATPAAFGISEWRTVSTARHATNPRGLFSYGM